MGCLALTIQDYFHVREVGEKNAYSRFSRHVPIDQDGNMLTDGTWTYTRNGENRLIAATSADTMLEFTYDYMGRRTEKKVYTGSTGNWTLSSIKKYVYDGYYQIAEFDGSANMLKSYLRAGGEIYAVTDASLSSTYFYMMDGNKNVMTLVDASGNVKADYTYDPFGRIIAKTGTYPDENPFRFSSEYFDTETSLVYYNYRYYSSELGRWLNRDPMEEDGSWNLYGMVGNNAIRFWDYLGLAKVIVAEFSWSQTKGKKVYYDISLDASVVFDTETCEYVWERKYDLKAGVGYGIGKKWKVGVLGFKVEYFYKFKASIFEVNVSNTFKKKIGEKGGSTSIDQTILNMFSGLSVEGQAGGAIEASKYFKGSVKGKALLRVGVDLGLGVAGTFSSKKNGKIDDISIRGNFWLTFKAETKLKYTAKGSIRLFGVWDKEWNQEFEDNLPVAGWEKEPIFNFGK